jgi:hypothetical protein
MTKTEAKFIIFSVAAWLWIGLFIATPAQAIVVIWKAPNADVTLGLPFNSLEFENPLNGTEKVKGYSVLQWRDADYKAGPPRWYDNWSVSNAAGIDGNANEIWMRQAGHSIWTNTTVASNIISIHMVGDNNDGLAEVRVDNIAVAQLDMGTKGLSQTALIIVRNLTYTTHSIRVNDLGIGPRSQIGDDVATLGAAALSPNWGAKWWPSFWFLNARIRLYRTDGYVTVPTGFWWGWYWWEGYRPWQGPAGWYEPYCRYWYRPYWDHWPYYSYYRPWWHYWKWWGGPWFWGFRDRLTFRYTYWQPRVIYWWSWYWDPDEQGGCIELVTQADEANPGGGRILPFPTAEIPGFEYSDHQFTVNGRSDIGGYFSTLTFIPVSDLQSHVSSILPADQVTNFMESDIVKQLQTAGTGFVGIQNATWVHPDPTIIVSTEPFTLIKGDTSGNAERMYEVSLPSPPTAGGMETVDIVSSSPEKLEVVDADSDGVKRLYFDEFNYSTPQFVTVRIVSGASIEGEERLDVAHFFESEPSNGCSLDVIVSSNECGSQGYPDADLNTDCKVDLLDFSIMATNWLMDTTPQH